MPLRAKSACYKVKRRGFLADMVFYVPVPFSLLFERAVSLKEALKKSSMTFFRDEKRKVRFSFFLHYSTA